jgi:hypothetical protein
MSLASTQALIQISSGACQQFVWQWLLRWLFGNHLAGASSRFQGMICPAYCPGWRAGPHR